MGLFSRKNDDADESNRSALFGGKKKKDTPAAHNPYAAPPAKDPYAQPPPAYTNGSTNGSYRQEKSPAVTGPNGSYGQHNGINGHQNGYGPNGGSNGTHSGYGNNHYGASPAPAARAGGYGGLGRSTSQDTMSTDAGRNELFGNAAQRQQAPRPQESGAYGQSGAYGDNGQNGGYGQAPDANGSYGDRVLTEEEKIEEGVTADKNEIKFIKQQDISSTRNALRLAQQAEETGRDTLSKLAYQGERLHNTESNLDRAARQNREAEEKARELKTLNKSMFAMHVNNPFTAKSRNAARDAEIMEKHHQDREVRDATRKAAWDSSARNEDFNRSLQGMNGTGKKNTLADRAQFQFEADSDDDEMENEIDSNLDALHGAAKRLNLLGRAMGTEVDAQNKHIAAITGKTDKVDDQIAMNRARLERIH